MTYSCVTVGTDFSERAGRAVEAAASFVRHHGTERIHLAHVVPFSGFYDAIPPTYSEAMQREVRKNALSMAEARLKQLAESLEIEARVTHAARLGKPGRDLAEIARDVGAQLCVVVSHGRRAVARKVLGSVASNLLRTAPCPVVVVRPDGPVLPGNREIMAAVDLSPISESVLRHAVHLAEPTGSTVRALALCEPPLWVAGGDGGFPGVLGRDSLESIVAETERALQGLVDRVRTEQVDIKAEVLRRGPPADAILDIAETVRPGFLLVGTSGRNAWHRFIVGATASRVVAEAKCPVVAVAPPELTDRRADEAEVTSS